MPVRQLVGVPVRQLVGVPEHKWIEKMKNIAKRNIFDFVSFWSELKFNILNLHDYFGPCRCLRDWQG